MWQTFVVRDTSGQEEPRGLLLKAPHVQVIVEGKQDTSAPGALSALLTVLAHDRSVQELLEEHLVQGTISEAGFKLWIVLYWCAATPGGDKSLVLPIGGALAGAEMVCKSFVGSPHTLMVASIGLNELVDWTERLDAELAQKAAQAEQGMVKATPSGVLVSLDCPISSKRGL